MVDVMVRAATPKDWPIVKVARLRALADAPYAFGSTLAREAAFDDAEWQRRVAPGNWFLAFSHDQPVGIVTTVVEDDAVHERHLVAMWVDPQLRGTSTATDLVHAVCAKAAGDDVAAITLWVADDNRRARRFYERLGFVSTGDRQPLPSNTALGEEKMRLVLPDAATGQFGTAAD